MKGSTRKTENRTDIKEVQAKQQRRKWPFMEEWGESVKCSRVRDDQCDANKTCKRRPRRLNHC